MKNIKNKKFKNQYITNSNIVKLLLNFLGNVFFCYCVIIALALILFSSVTIECEVIGSSMYPTLNYNKTSKVNDVVFVNIYDRELNYGDIVVVKTDEDSIIKRVIGKEGDIIDVVLSGNEYKIERNGQILDENYILMNLNPSIPAIEKNGMEQTYDKFQELKEKFPELFDNDYNKLIVPENSIFVLGDNREVSLDSSYYGPFDMSKFEGKVELIKRANVSQFKFYYDYIIEGKFIKTFLNLF